MADDIRLTGIDSVAPYPLATTDDLYALPPPAFIIEDFLPEAAITGITSYPGVGKTWFAFEAARALATKDRFLGRFQAVEGAVLFVGSDASIYDYAKQWRRLTTEQFKKLQPDNDSSPDYENPLKANVRFLIQSDFLFENIDSIRRLIRSSRQFTWGPPHEVFDEETGETDVVYNHGFCLIVFDTLSKLTRANQSDNSQMEEVFRNIRFLSEQTGAAIMLLHHNAKTTEFNDGEDWRGAMAQIGALDAWFQLTPEQADKEIVQVKVKKFRGITPPPFYYKMAVNSGDMDEEPPASLTVVDEPVNPFTDGITESALDVLTSSTYNGHWLTVKQIADALFDSYKDFFNDDRGKFEAALRNRLKHEVRKAKPTVRTSGGGSRGRRVMYSATPGMAEALAQDKSLKVEE